MHIPLIDDALAPLSILPLIDSGMSSAINGANSTFCVGFIIGPGPKVGRHMMLSYATYGSKLSEQLLSRTYLGSG